MIRPSLSLVPSQGISFHSKRRLNQCLATSWALVLVAKLALGAEAPPVQAPVPTKPIKDTPTEVLVERKNAITAEMRRLDSEYQLIPFRFRELESVVKEIDTELAKRQPGKSPKPAK